MAKEKTKAGNRWTEGRERTFIRSALRSAFMRWPPRFDALKSSQTGVKVNKKTKRDAMHYRCAQCTKEFPQRDVQVDHIDPVVADEWKSWDEYIARLLVTADELQVLCKKCHAAKTKQERARRSK